MKKAKAYHGRVFQSTCPARGTTRKSATWRRLRRFQSTCPARGTTPPCRLQARRGFHFNPRAPRGARLYADTRGGESHAISIHVPREGHDRGGVCRKTGTGISIHVPREGHDRDFILIRLKAGISIHVPREGHDDILMDVRSVPPHFNPRAPRGARPGRCPRKRHILSAFQSTCPARGTTLNKISIKISSMYFNPRAPRGARPCINVLRRCFCYISIHVPREGHDIQHNRDYQ